MTPVLLAWSQRLRDNPHVLCVSRMSSSGGEGIGRRWDQARWLWCPADLPATVRDGLDINLVSHMDEVLAIAFVAAPRAVKQLAAVGV